MMNGGILGRDHGGTKKMSVCGNILPMTNTLCSVTGCLYVSLVFNLFGKLNGVASHVFHTLFRVWTNG
jgi:hypothetical protein